MLKINKQNRLIIGILTVFCSLFNGFIPKGIALPPPEDLPEEVLRTQIIIEGRSPIDGKPLNASEYAQLEADLIETEVTPEIDPALQHLIFLLRVRKLLKGVNPFN